MPRSDAKRNTNTQNKTVTVSVSNNISDAAEKSTTYCTALPRILIIEIAFGGDKEDFSEDIAHDVKANILPQVEKYMRGNRLLR